MVGIVGYGCYIPRYRIKVEDIAKAHGSEMSQIKGLRINEKSVPGIDEDAATIAVAAARNALGKRYEIGAVFIGSESHPYAVKPTGTIVGEALDIGNRYMCADFEFACKAGTTAIQVCIGLVESGMIRYGIAGGADTAQAAPGDALDYSAAAGGAIFVIGSQNVIAEINHTVSFTSDTPDFWRRAYQRYPAHGGAFTGEPAYFRHVSTATKMLMGKAKTAPEDYTYVIFHQPNGKFPRRVANRLGFSENQCEPGILVGDIGNTYSGSSLLGLCAVLDIAKPGDRILLTSYGSGAGSDSFDITVTERIKDFKTKSVKGYINNKVYIDYPRYLKQIRALK